MTELLSINIGIDPNITKIGGLLITWHGVFTAIGIVAGVWLAVRLAESARVGIDGDTAYTIGMIVVACGLVGARALYVIENYGDSPTIDSVGDIFRITEGGISIYGAIIGGALGGSTGALIGAAIGGIGGYAVGRQMEIEDQRRVALALEQNRAMSWENPDTGHMYRVQPTRTVYERGRECREFRMVGDVEGRPDEFYGTACRAPDGSWQMVSG